MTAFLVYFPLYLLGGAFAGTLAGLLGVGGGLVVVPLLAKLLPLMGLNEDIVMQMAVGTSLSVIVVTSLSSIRVHSKHKQIRWDTIKIIVPWIIVGAVLGAWFATLLPSEILGRGFGCFVLVIASIMLFSVNIQGNYQLPGKVGLSIAGTLIGLISTMLGMAGGAITVPFFNYCQFSMRSAVSTAAVCSLPVSITGVISYMILGYGAEGLPPLSTGYVYWPAFLGIASSTMLFAPLGAALTHKLPTAILKRVFAVFLLIVGLEMILS